MLDLSTGKFLGTVAIALLAAGCGGGGGGSTSSAPPVDASDALTISIRNDQMDVASVVLFINEVPRRLGEVRGLGRRTFQVPMERSEPVSMAFNLALGARCITRDLVLGPGDRIDVEIPVNLDFMEAVCDR